MGPRVEVEPGAVFPRVRLARIGNDSQGDERIAWLSRPQRKNETSSTAFYRHASVTPPLQQRICGKYNEIDMWRIIPRMDTRTVDKRLESRLKFSELPFAFADYARRRSSDASRPMP